MKVVIIGGIPGEAAYFREAMLSISAAGGSTDLPAPRPELDIVLIDELENLSIRQLHQLREDVGIDATIRTHYRALSAWSPAAEATEVAVARLSTKFNHPEIKAAALARSYAMEGTIALSQKERDWLLNLQESGSLMETASLDWAIQEQLAGNVKDCQVAIEELRGTIRQYASQQRHRPAGHYTAPRDADKRRRAKNRRQRKARRK